MADELEDEENFNFQASLVVFCDNKLREEEDQFLMEFANKLELSRIDTKRLFQEATNFFAEYNDEEEE
ncbi:hypothetical protein [Leptospira sp. GIMC2001]|uniref:hypothetical protein n=1 Tax=Leptospira sp. GIMC2001 TaxID=1513297 RepID=UPI00234BCB9B|nr:hypothetical protein [Leptospira sp. GIMC2001]WCL50795.1 hypothetical protein O4O04_08280 [Leptospira sp. GIMC2001]